LIWIYTANTYGHTARRALQSLKLVERPEKIYTSTAVENTARDIKPKR
jgi:hypothetical protein